MIQKLPFLVKEEVVALHSVMKGASRESHTHLQSLISTSDGSKPKAQMQGVNLMFTVLRDIPKLLHGPSANIISSSVSWGEKALNNRCVQVSCMF